MRHTRLHCSEFSRMCAVWHVDGFWRWQSELFFFYAYPSNKSVLHVQTRENWRNIFHNFSFLCVNRIFGQARRCPVGRSQLHSCVPKLFFSSCFFSLYSIVLASAMYAFTPVSSEFFKNIAFKHFSSALLMGQRTRHTSKHTTYAEHQLPQIHVVHFMNVTTLTCGTTFSTGEWCWSSVRCKRLLQALPHLQIRRRSLKDRFLINRN